MRNAESMNMNTMNTTTPPPTPETGEGSPSLANFTIQKLERELNEAREQIASCAINTNVRLFDLVRQMRAELHEDDLITDEEYFWLCGGCEMATSPEGGSPSPRRLEDYDVLSEKLEAMREAIKEAHALMKAMEAVVDAAKCIRHWHDAGTDGMIVSRWHVFKLWEALAALRENDQAQAALTKLQPFLP